MALFWGVQSPELCSYKSPDKFAGVPAREIIFIACGVPEAGRYIPTHSSGMSDPFLCVYLHFRRSSRTWIFSHAPTASTDASTSELVTNEISKPKRGRKDMSAAAIQPLLPFEDPCFISSTDVHIQNAGRSDKIAVPKLNTSGAVLPYYRKLAGVVSFQAEEKNKTASAPSACT